MIWLSKTEIARAWVYAHVRNDGKVLAGYSGEIDTSVPPLWLNFYGCCGEIGVLERKLGIEVTQLPGPHDSDGGIYDGIFLDNTVQVKTLIKDYPRLYLYYNDILDFKADITVVCQYIQNGGVYIHGWMRREDYLDIFEVVDFKQKGFVYGVRVEKLSPIEHLVRMRVRDNLI